MRIYKPEGMSSSKFTGFKKEDLEAALRDQSILEAPVTKCDSNLNIFIDLGSNIYGVIPNDEFEYTKDDTKVKSVAIISRVAKYTCFKVVSMATDESGKLRVELSRKLAQKDCYENYIDNLKLGQVIDARITHIESYGAFCDIGCGVISLLPIESFCVARIKNAKADLKQFTELKVIVKAIENNRVTLSHKELLGTWEEEAAKFKAGDTVIGTVRLVESYGIFVELTPNLAGLAEVSEGIEAGDVVSVFIKSVVPEKMKIKLIISSKNNDVKHFISLDYRIPASGFVNHWVYSPDCASRVIETTI